MEAVYAEGSGSRIIDYTVPAMEVDLFEARATFETNFFAVINICQTFLPLLKRAQGTIVQIGSVAGVSLLLYMPQSSKLP
jgi:NAD(P)-dependent dehydrogenase (short-subunit alcohol dehydrogenase family)